MFSDYPLFMFLKNTAVALPAIEVSILITVLTICLLFRFNRIGLVAAYVFTYRWGWLFFSKENHGYLIPYFIFGGLVLFLTVISLFRRPPAE